MTNLTTIAEVADELTNPIRVREGIYDRINGHRKMVRVWTLTMPSLLDQLAAAIYPGEVYMEDNGGHIHHTPRSIPPARLDAIDACLRIQAGAAMWVTRAGLTPRDSTASNVRSLVAAQVDSDTAKEILADLRRWYGLAATLTGWERPAWRPDAPCPACDARGLRVHLARKTAACVNCGEAWTPDTIGILGDYVASLTTREPA